MALGKPMATHDLLSRHSSNPLEVATSDPQNAKYIKQYLKVHEAREIYSSDDPLGGYQVNEMEEYQQHIADLCLKQTTGHEEVEEVQTEDMELYSDDELVIVDEEDDEVNDDVEVSMEDLDVDDGDETDEELTIYSKVREEREDIEKEIADLEEAVPQLSQDYKLVDRLGTGTFSSVYKAVDLEHHFKWHNANWLGRHPPASSAYYQSLTKPPEAKVMVAIKRIYVTSNPERIRNEISIMEDCRGCRHVSQLITAFRERDQVVAIMPYHRNEDFRDIYRVLNMDGIKAYFRCLLRALRDIHARGIIHRDVKPANFLFDPRSYTGTLCDFGLACRVEFGAPNGLCLHTAPTQKHLHGMLRTKATFDIEHIKSMQREARQKSSWPSDRVGYPEKDYRPLSKANRAGTRGFRAPEVLLKCNEQTGAIDIWATGMILLFFLAGKFPLFQSNDDIEALMEIATILGKRRMEKTATLHNRTFATNVPSITQDGITWRDFVERQNPDIVHPRSAPSRSTSQSFHPNTASPTSDGPPTDSQSYEADLELVFDLLEQLLQPESHKRITARDALYHPFLASSAADDDDDVFFPHPVGGGVCGHFHFRDEVTEEHCVTNAKGPAEVRRLCAGEGVPIGREPCEYHEHIDFGIGPELKSMES